MNKATRPGGKGWFWDAMAAVMLVLTLIMLAYITLIGLQPASPLNPFPPPTPALTTYIPTGVQTTVITSPTVNIMKISATASPTDTETPTRIAVLATATFTPEPALTPTIISTSTPDSTRVPTVTPAPTLTPPMTPSPARSPFTFTATINYQIHPVLTCDWTGVAGTVVDLKDQPTRGYMVQITDAEGTVRQVKAGSSPDYGPGGWELRLGGRQVTGIWQVQLYAASNPKDPASEVYEVALPGLCQKNLAFVRFQQNH